MAWRTGGCAGRCLLPLLLLTASLLDWSLISLVNMVIFFAIRFVAPRRGSEKKRRLANNDLMENRKQMQDNDAGAVVPVGEAAEEAMQRPSSGLGLHHEAASQCKAMGTRFSAGKVLAAAGVWDFVITDENLVSYACCFCEGRGADACFTSFLSRIVPSVASTKLSAAVLSLVEVFRSRIHQDSCWLNFSFDIEQIGYHFRVACCLLLPAVQLIVSISHPSWISLPFFVFSCIGLVDWSLTSNFLGLFRWWRLLEIYSVFSILLLYIYQLRVKFPYVVVAFADFIGLFKVSSKSEWPELSSGISLLVYYFMSFHKVHVDMGLDRFRYRECLEEACVLCVVRLVCLAPSALLNEGLHILFHARPVEEEFESDKLLLDLSGLLIHCYTVQ
ncbi:unnamed protein product [Triticum turgidum subsp. durum]|uniref:Uncharacterized protein n=1 Tax=Triticum turgidum subsp. durum TaxID=4567 RepID=A0A9R0RI73_TRITD|nr:unnamed protein product [Triticum turgidum subsp. durum]